MTKRQELKRLIEESTEITVDIDRLLKEEEINLKNICVDACYFGIENRIEYLVLCNKNMREVKAIKSEDLKKYAR